MRQDSPLPLVETLNFLSTLRVEKIGAFGSSPTDEFNKLKLVRLFDEIQTFFSA